MFFNFHHKESGHVTYGHNNQGKFIVECVVGNPSTIIVGDVLLVKGLKYNLLSVSQLCDKGYSIVFYMFSCSIEHKDSKSIMFKGSRVENIYFLDLYDVSRYDTKCLVIRN